MEGNGNCRTDLASEAHRMLRNGKRDLSPLPGVEAREETRDGVSLFRVRVTDEHGAKALGKPVGRYCTLEPGGPVPRGDVRFPQLARTLAGVIREMLAAPGGPFLVVGLGNESITPDALGPLAARNVLATRHLKRAGNPLFARFHEVSVCAPGVLGSSGLEAALQIGALCREIRPKQLLVIDALAGAEPIGLGCSFQITDSGIAPGSGVGNDRSPLSRESMGLPVLALGVPTVIDAARFGDSALHGMFVTPRDVDELVRSAARMLAYAVDLALHPSLRFEELSALLE